MTNEFQPDWSSPPGDTIHDIMAEKKLNPTEVARALGMSMHAFSYLLVGIVTIDDALAVKLESVLGGTAEFWKVRERHFREHETTDEGS